DKYFLLRYRPKMRKFLSPENRMKLLTLRLFWYDPNLPILIFPIIKINDMMIYMCVKIWNVNAGVVQKKNPPFFLPEVGPTYPTARNISHHRYSRILNYGHLEYQSFAYC